MPSSKFGASKFRNAVLSTPNPKEWYRSSLTSASSSTSSSITTFSSEIKCNREWIVTVTPGGDISYRGYRRRKNESLDVGEGFVGSFKVGGVGDWDLGMVENGNGWDVGIGGLDGVVTIYRLPLVPSPTAKLEKVCTISSSGSPISCLSFHPTTPSIILLSTPTSPFSVYDISNLSSPVLKLSGEMPNPEPKGLWSVSWSNDGKLVGAISRTGVCSIWDLRSSTKPLASKTLPIQSLKPARLIFVNDNQVFITSTSKTRDRQYSLLSSATSSTPLSTICTQTVDQNTAPLLTAYDASRGIIYLSSRGDMTLRQIELSGPQGYQETLHPLPQAVASSGLALTSMIELDVMQAEIAGVVLQGSDKDGEGLILYKIKVPRRQLIDYHEDLYPDIEDTLTQQGPNDWFEGGEKPLSKISLDPAKRQVWQNAFYERSAVNDSSAGASMAEEASVPRTKQSSSPNPTISSLPVSSTTAVLNTSTPVPHDTTVRPSLTDPPNLDLPPLQKGETYSSTSYKIRIVGQHIASQLELHRKEGKKAPLMVGLQGPQGCGKTTLCDALLGYLREAPRSLKVAVLSLDDLYRTNAGLKALAAKHSDNALLAGRGPPGTHDVDLANAILSAVTGINETADRSVGLPIFDKSLCGGEGDRSSETIQVSSPLDIFILEGWSMGFPSIPDSDLKHLYERTISSPPSPAPYFTKHPLKSLMELNNYLSEFSSQVYPHFSTIVQIQPKSFEYVFKWRLEQEHHMKAGNGGRGMSDEQVHRFVERYMPGYEIWSEGVWGEMPWKGRGLRLFFGDQREVVKVEQPVAVRITTSPFIATQQDQAPSQRVTQDNKVGVQAIAEASSSRKTAEPSNTKPFNPNYSRNFLAGKSPLIPTYDALPPLATLHQDSQILKITPKFAFFPIQGPGGRLVVHDLTKKGRMIGGEGYLSTGSEIVDFDVERFNGGRVAVAGEDGVVRVWKIGSTGAEGSGEAVLLRGKGIDKIAQVVFHPTAKDLIVVLSNDQDKPHLHFFDLSSAEEKLVVSLSTNGAFNMTFSPDGSRIAIATKTNEIMVLDPRRPEHVHSGKAHDSPRSFQVTWIDSAHLISVGFSKGSSRTINLYEITSTTIKTIHTTTIDVSPAVLFPIYDPDTRILYIWGKGERVIQAYEINLDAQKTGKGEMLLKLPSFTSGSPQVGYAVFPKRMVDVKKVEVVKGLRLTAKTMEEVSFTIPRNKPEFFQDDIYVPTTDVENPSMSAKEWLGGQNAALGHLDLKPNGMTKLSEAPQTTSKFVKKPMLSKDILSEEEKKRREMDELFQKAKLEESSDEDEKKGLDPPDDDW